MEMSYSEKQFIISLAREIIVGCVHSNTKCTAAQAFDTAFNFHNEAKKRGLIEDKEYDEDDKCNCNIARVMPENCLP